MQEDLFDVEAFSTINERLNKITLDSVPSWGKMNASQMLAHCAEVQETMNGKSLKTPIIIKLFAPLIKKMVVKGDYKKNTRTHPAYKQQGNKDFLVEKKRLVEALSAFVDSGEENAASLSHSFFGKMSAHEKGRAMFKHLDYHLKQFNV